MKVKELFKCLADLNDQTIVTIKGVGETFSCKYKHLSPAIKDLSVKKAYFKRDCNGEMWEEYFIVEVER